MSIYSDKNVLVTGGSGLIGRALVELLIDKGARVKIASLDDPTRAPKHCEFLRLDLREFKNCLRAAKDCEFVFHLAGIGGSPALTNARPASFLVPSLMLNTNMMEAARQLDVERYLFASTVGVYAPAELLRENDVWCSFPSKNDWFSGWGKRVGELQAQAYKIEYNWDKISIVRPANVYGPYDNFSGPSARVVGSLIHRAVSGENPLVVWGDGSPIRDFIHCRDVARGMILALEKGITDPINLGTGTGITIKRLAIAISNAMGGIKIVWDEQKPQGDRVRLMDTTRAESYGIKTQISLEDGITETLNWYKENKNLKSTLYSAFSDQKYAQEP